MTEGTAASRKRKLLRGPRRKDEQQQAAGHTVLDVDLCEILPLSPNHALLRVAGRWTGPVPATVELLVGRDALVAPLPPGPRLAADGHWSAGFQLTAANSSADFTLVSATGASPLPRPHRTPPAGPTAELEEARGQIVSLTARCEVNERELAEFRGKLVDAWAEVSSMRETLNGRAEDYEDASRRATQAVAIMSELKARAERAEGIRDDLDAQVSKARQMARDALEVTTKAARELIAERAELEEATARAERQSEELSRVERELHETRDELAAAHARLKALTAELEAVRDRLSAAEARLAGAEAEAITQRQRAQRAETESADSAEHEINLGEQASALEAATAELEELRERFAQAVTRSDELEAQLLAASEEKPPAEPRSRPFGRSKVAARVHVETLERLEHEEAERTRVEAEAAELAERVRDLETEIARYHDRVESAGVEEDLRHLLATRQRELEETRAELKEQRARYAAVASKMSPAELAETAETRPAPQDDWTAVDEELLGRLARAKQLSQPE